ncbi:hypothetical protein Bpfe_016878 [Biomphalaria pfeifferi]|uniref:Uncharacterized protein n=1 Tax=Biomphalaria pfeifferi TaxID=112525 RepID=A0AAD8F7N0_BIOPF|nr:hypothetical protein Bpfe_016878 [Biomphalaria pfeifferi]
MADDIHDYKPLSGPLLLGFFITLILALNASSREQAALLREAYQDSNESVLLIFTALVTLFQIWATLSLLSVETVRGDLPNKEALVIIVFCHAGNLFLHDYLASLGSLETSLCMAFFQPLLTLLALWLVTSVIPRWPTLVSTMAIGIGCTFMSIKSSTVLSSDRTSLICALSAFALILRNIVLRHLISSEHVKFKLRDKRSIGAATLASILVLMIMFFQVSSILQVPVLCGFVTCSLSAILAYVTVQMLKSYSLVVLSLFQVWALLVEAVIITPSDHRPDIFAIIIAIVFIVFGHYVFMKDYHEHHNSTSSALIPTHAQKPVNTHEQYTRIEFLMFTCLVLGVIFYVFQPRVSQRDLQTLSYVGLDKIIRRLLTFEPVDLSSIDDEQAHPHQLP